MTESENDLERRFGSAVSDEYGVLFKTIVIQEKSGVLDEQMPEAISKILLLVKETIEHALEARILLTYGRVLHATWMSAGPNIQKAVRLFKDRINAIHGDLETIIRSDDADESFMQIAWSSTLDDLQQAASVKGKAAEGMKNRLYDIMRQSFKLPRKAGRKYFISELDTLCMKMINDAIDNAIIEFTSAGLTEIELTKTRCIHALEQDAKNRSVRDARLSGLLNISQLRILTTQSDGLPKMVKMRTSMASKFQTLCLKLDRRRSLVRLKLNQTQLPTLNILNHRHLALQEPLHF